MMQNEVCEKIRVSLYLSEMSFSCQMSDSFFYRIGTLCSLITQNLYDAPNLFDMQTCHDPVDL